MVENKIKDKWYSARFDRVFKDIFCGEDNQEMLESFLSRLLKKNVKIEMYLTNELKQEHQDVRRKTVDLLVKIDKEYILLELNNGYSSITNFRNYIFFSSVISQKTKRGEKYDNDVKFLLINLTYGLPNSVNFYVDRYGLLSLEGTNEMYLDNIEVLVFNMDKIMESWYNKDMEHVEEFKHLIMLDCNKEDLKILSKGDKLVEEFTDRIDELNTVEYVDFFISPEQDEMMMRNAEIGLAKKEGIEEGIEIGLEKGRIKGKKELVQTLLEKGVSKEIIANSLNIPVSELEEYIK